MGLMNKLTRGVRSSASASATVGLRRRVTALEAEVQECQALNLRMAELMDIVTELVLPIAQRDDEKLREALAKYQESI